jgi:hypothetical protein
MKYLILLVLLVACEQPQYTPIPAFCWKCIGRHTVQTGPLTAQTADIAQSYCNMTSDQIKAIESKYYIRDEVNHVYQYISCEKI